MTVFKEIVAKFGVRVLTFAALGVLVVVGYSCMETKNARDKAIMNAEANAKLADAAKELGFVKGELLSEREAGKRLGGSLAKAYKALKAKGATLDSTSQTKVEISDTTAGGLLGVPGGDQFWQDEHHRFTLQLPAGPLKRHQLFGLDGIVVRSLDGTIKATDYNFKEFDPETKEEIPIEGAKLETKFQFVEDEAPGPGRFHVRGVGGIDYRGAPAAGIQINPVGNLTVGLIGIYSPQNKEGRGVVHAGWRIFSTTISVGPYVGISSRGGGVLFGAAATIEVTR